MIEGMVSTIIPVWNRPSLLRECVGSVIAQTYRPIEIIIVDDGSTDDTPQVATELVNQYPELIRFVHQENAGPGAARESGRSQIRGEFIQYLDSDDLLLERKFERQVAALRENSGCGIANCRAGYRGPDGEPIDPFWKEATPSRGVMMPSFLRARWWDTPAPLYRGSLCDAAGPWSSLRLEEDWEYDCRLASLGTEVCDVDEVLVEIRDHETDRLSRGTARDAVRMVHRARAHELMASYATCADVDSEDPDVRQFARRLFLLARQCGAAGLPDESHRLFRLAREMSGPRSSAIDFRLYRLLATLVGWTAAGRLSEYLDNLRQHLGSVAE